MTATSEVGSHLVSSHFQPGDCLISRVYNYDLTQFEDVFN